MEIANVNVHSHKIIFIIPIIFYFQVRQNNTYLH